MKVSTPILLDKIPAILKPLLSSLTGFVRTVKAGDSCLISTKRDNGRVDWSVPVRFEGRVGNSKAAKLIIAGERWILKENQACMFTFEDRNRCVYVVRVTNAGRTHGENMAVRIESAREVSIVWNRIGLHK